MARWWVKTEPETGSPLVSGLVLTQLPKPCDTLRDRAEERLVSAGTQALVVVCSPSTPSGWPKATPQSRGVRPGQAEDETAPAGQHRTADRLAEKAGERRVFISGRQAPGSAERSIFLRVAEGRSGRNADARSF
jgi:hypothetical protein